MTTTVNTKHALNAVGIGAAITAEANMQATFKALGCLRDYVNQTDTALSAEVEELWEQINLLKTRPGVTAEEIANAINQYFSAHPNVLNLPCMVDADGNQFSFASYVNVVSSLPQTKGYRLVKSTDANNPIPAGIVYKTTKGGDLVMTRDSVEESTDAEGITTQLATFAGTFRGFAIPMALVQKMKFEVTEPAAGCGKFLSLIEEDYPVIDFATEISPCPNAPDGGGDTPTEPEAPVEPEAPTEPEAPIEPEAPVEPEVPTEPEVPAEPEAPITPEVPDTNTTPPEAINPDAPVVDPITPPEPEIPVEEVPVDPVVEPTPEPAPETPVEPAPTEPTAPIDGGDGTTQP